MTSVSNVQSFREAYEAYKTSYTPNKGRETLSHYSDSAKAYRVFKNIGKELLENGADLEPKQQRIVSQVLEKIRQVRHSQKKELKAFSEKMSGSFESLQSSSSSSQSGALKEEAQRRMDEFRVKQLRIQNAFNVLSAKALKLINFELTPKQKEAIGALNETQKNIVKQLIGDVSSVYARAASGKIRSEAEVKQEVERALARALNSTRTTLKCALESIVPKCASTADFVSYIKSSTRSLESISRSPISIRSISRSSSRFIILSEQTLARIARQKGVNEAKDKFINLVMMETFESNLKAIIFTSEKTLTTELEMVNSALNAFKDLYAR
ncbi:MAG: hypothetical protein K2P51_02025 [Rhabdochlamydiaceae bacterium]|nr:hypothetical protein [Rhabdochlamydiaceae bacterium]